MIKNTSTIPPIYNLVWDKELELWTLEIADSEMQKINLANLRTRIEEYMNSA
jgi:hypothetical protein